MRLAQQSAHRASQLRKNASDIAHLNRKNRSTLPEHALPGFALARPGTLVRAPAEDYRPWYEVMRTSRCHGPLVSGGCLVRVQTQLLDWFGYLGDASAAHAWQLVAFLVMMVASAGLTALVLVQLPADHFDAGARDAWLERLPRVQRAVVRVLKNLLGVALVATGVVLALPGVPGQGLLTILIGLMLLDLPWVRRLERWLLARPTVLTPINRLRKRFGKPPFHHGDGAAA